MCYINFMEQDNIIGAAETRFGYLEVEQIDPSSPRFNVSVNGVIKHPNCSVDAVIRALCHYIHGAEYSLMKND